MKDQSTGLASHHMTSLLSMLTQGSSISGVSPHRSYQALVCCGLEIRYSKIILSHQSSALFHSVFTSYSYCKTSMMSKNLLIHCHTIAFCVLQDPNSALACFHSLTVNGIYEDLRLVYCVAICNLVLQLLLHIDFQNCISVSV